MTVQLRGKNQRFRRRGGKLQSAGVTGPGAERTRTKGGERPISFGARMRYRFDNLLARGSAALILLLAVLSLVIIVISSLVVVITRTQPSGVGVWEMFYRTFLHTIDTGNVGGDTGSPWFLLVMVLATLGGIFIVSALIGVITTGLDNQLAQLRRGRSQVLEQNHTLILGWSPQIFSVISELVIANENQRHPSIVILAEKDKVEMEDEIHTRLPNLKNTRVVCRTGNPLELSDLEIGSPQTSRSIIILAPQVEEPDTHVIMTLLAITNHPRRRAEPYHIVAQIRDTKNMEVAAMVGGEEAQLILGDDLIARITVQTCRQSGLSVVYTELMDFDGDEIYFQDEPALVGTTFSDSLMKYEDSSVIGLQRADGATYLNPPMDSVIQEGDRIIAITEDDDTLIVSDTQPEIDESAIQHVPPAAQTPERSLILGWNKKVPTIMRELDNYVASNSHLTVVTNNEGGAFAVKAQAETLQNLNVDYLHGDTTDRHLLDSLNIPSFDHVIVLSDGGMADSHQADARTLITLLHLRDMQERDGHAFSIVSEMLDVRNRELAEVTQADDFVVSDQLVSLMMSQISENKYLNALFTDIFDADGSEIYLKAAEQYVRLDGPVNFYTVVAAARSRGEIAIGYRKMALANSADDQYGVSVNPKKREMVNFESGDKIIVVAED